jgi:hypothetical protein
MPYAGDYVRASDTTAHYCFAYQSVAQSIPTGVVTFTAITMGTDHVDTDNIHDPVTNSSRLVIGGILGWWEISGCVAYAAVASGSASETRRAGITFNGSAGPVTQGGQIILPFFTGTNGLTSIVVPPIEVQATLSTDYVELGAAHNNAGSINTTVSGGYRSHIRAKYLGPS